MPFENQHIWQVKRLQIFYNFDKIHFVAKTKMFD